MVLHFHLSLCGGFVVHVQLVVQFVVASIAKNEEIDKMIKMPMNLKNLLSMQLMKNQQAFPYLKGTVVWKFKNFPTRLIFREINFSKFS